MDADQRIAITLSVSKQTHRELVLGQSITTSVVTASVYIFEDSKVSDRDIHSRLKCVLGVIIYVIGLRGLAGDKNVNTMTIVNESDRFMIGKKLVLDADGYYSEQRDISVQFSLHGI